MHTSVFFCYREIPSFTRLLFHISWKALDSCAETHRVTIAIRPDSGQTSPLRDIIHALRIKFRKYIKEDSKQCVS